MIVDHPEDYGVYSQTHFSFNNIRQMNRNELLGEPGVDGIKTGHTEEAGFCLVSSAKRGDMRLVAVVLGTASRADVGSNVPLVLNAGSTTTGDSAFGVTLTGAGTTATIPLRVIDVVPETATSAGVYTELLVKINTHQYNSTTGV